MTKRPYLRAEERRRQLLEAVGRLFDLSGFGGITMAGAAVEAGVSRQLVYDHFDDLGSLCDAFVETRLARYRASRPDISAMLPDEAAATMFRHLLTIPSTDRRVVRLLVADVGLPALDRLRARFRAEELARWPNTGSPAPRTAVASAAMWATSSAFLALADAVADGRITDTEATAMAVGIAMSTSNPPDTDLTPAYGGVVSQPDSGSRTTAPEVDSGVAFGVERWTAFGSGPGGGNPAGVWIGDRLPTPRVMQRIAAEVGYSETAFLESTTDPGRWNVRYFSPGVEVDFCGHATIASAVALGRRYGSATFHFSTVVGDIPVVVDHDGDTMTATLTSVEPEHREPLPKLLDEVLDAMFLTREQLDRNLHPDLAYAGAWHLVLPLESRDDLAGLRYDFDRLARLMTQEHLTTVQAIWREHPHRFHARNPFPVGGIVEDPATGAAAAALGGYLRIHHHLHPPTDFDIVQGVDMGRPSLITVHVPTSGGIDVTGTASEIPSTA